MKDYGIDSKIYIQFPYQIPPRLNKMGTITCFFNSTPANCELISERYIKLFPTSPMLKGT